MNLLGRKVSAVSSVTTKALGTGLWFKVVECVCVFEQNILVVCGSSV